MKIKTNCSLNDGPGKSSAYWLTKAFNDLGHEIVTGYEADLVINIDGMRPVDSLPNAKYFFWDCDSFLHGPTEDISKYDQVFIGGSPEDLSRYPEGTVYIPHAFDQDIHKRHDVEQIFDVVMIGNTDNNLYKKRNELVNKIGKHFNIYHDQIEFGEPYAKAMSKGKLIFNHTLGEKNIPIRFFEGMAIGALLENYNENLDDLATKHVHYIPYTEDDLLIMIDYYLTHDDIRENLIKNANEHALKHHTYKHRAERILSYV